VSSRPASRDYSPNPEAPWPIFGCEPHVPEAACPHCGPLPDYSRGVCMVCHATGDRLESRLDREFREAVRAEREADAVTRQAFQKELAARRRKAKGRKRAA
jgi:hypothetical protein